MIRYLNQEEKRRTRQLYESCFPEDDASFIDYYYQYKTRENRILVMEEEKESGKLQAMIHLNPYRFQVCKNAADVSYVVAVASDPSVRRQGKMAMVMKRALLDLAKEGQPFAFLIPANPRVYESSGFTFLLGEDYGDLRFMAREDTESLRAAELMPEPFGAAISLAPALPKDIPQMVTFAKACMDRQYDIFPLKDEFYFRRMMEELKSQSGGFLLLKNQGELLGMVSYGTDGIGGEIQEILIKPGTEKILMECLEAYFKGNPPEISDMKYMIRILSIGRLAELLRSREPFRLKVQVTDDLIEENNGSFDIRIGEQGGSVRRIARHEAERGMDIAGLARVLFERQRIFIREWV